MEPVSEVSPCGHRELSTGFDCATFLAKACAGRNLVKLERKDGIFLQGDQPDAVFYIEDGQVELTVVSQNGKQATITQLDAVDFIGEECVAPDQPARKEEPASSLFVSYLLARRTRLEAGLVE